MRLSTVVSIVFILHIHWACGESSTTALPQSTEKSINVGKNPAIQETQSAKDSKKSNVEPGVVLNKLLQKQQPEQEQQSGSIEVDLQASLLNIFTTFFIFHIKFYSIKLCVLHFNISFNSN